MGIDFPTVLFGNRGVNPPAEAYLAEQDQLIVTSQSSRGTLVQVAARVLMPNGTVKPFAYQHQMNSLRTPLTEVFPLCEGFLLGLSVTVLPIGSSAVPRGQSFMSVWIGMGQGAAITLLHPLVSDYVVGMHPIGWPGSPLLHPTDGPGNIVGSVVLNAPGGTLLYSQPNNTRWRFQSLVFEVTTSAVVAARIPRVTFTGPAPQPFWSRLAPGSQGAGVTVDYSCAAGDSDRGVAQGFTNIGAPVGIIIAGAGSVQVNVLATQAGDTIGGTLQVEEWINTA